jgi:hypothetical protein
MADKPITNIDDFGVGILIKHVIKVGISRNKGPELAWIFSKGGAKIEINSEQEVQISGSGVVANFIDDENKLESMGIEVGNKFVELKILCSKPDENQVMIWKAEITVTGMIYGYLSGSLDLTEFKTRFDQFLDHSLTGCGSPFCNSWGHYLHWNKDIDAAEKAAGIQ